NFRVNYISSLGLQIPSEQSHVEPSQIENSILTQLEVDLNRLKTLTERWDIPGRARSLAWRYLLGVLPPRRDSSRFVWTTQSESFEDLRHSTSVAFAQTIEPRVRGALLEGFSEEVRKVRIRRQTLSERSRTSLLHTSNENLNQTQPPFLSSMSRSFSSLPVPDFPMESSDTTLIEPSERAVKEYLLGQQQEDFLGIYDILTMAHVFISVMDDSAAFWSLCKLLEKEEPHTKNNRTTLTTSGELFLDHAFSDSRLKRRVTELERLLGVVDPQFKKILDDRGVSVAKISHRLWDRMIGRPNFVIFLSLSAILLSKNAILELPPQKNVYTHFTETPLPSIESLCWKAMELSNTGHLPRSLSMRKRTKSPPRRFEAPGSDTVHVKFRLEYITHFGQVLCIAGSCPELGAWNVHRMKQMTWNEGGIWTADLPFKRSHLPFEYKYNVYEPLPKRIVRWESIPGNRRVDLKRVNDGSWEYRDAWDIP
ncbi:hypothetical protein PROFUN_15658, partial [Planoprotostelium fungivorum]